MSDEQSHLPETPRAPLLVEPLGIEELAPLFDDERGDVIALFSSDGQMMFMSPACSRLTGWPSAFLVEKNIDDFVHLDDLPGVLTVRGAVMQSPAAVVSTFRFRCSDDSYLWLEALVRRVAHPRDPDKTVIVASIREIADRKLVEVRLERQAFTDPLTGIANRTVVMDRLEHALLRLERVRSVLALIYLDLDRFKVINDSLGHEVGDRLLMAVAERAVAVLRPADTLARLGGDEFVIIAEDLSDASEALTIAKRVCADIERPFDLDGKAIVCTASAGVATTTDAGHSALGLLQEADLALYRAKDRGRNRAETFDEELRANAVRRLGTELMIRSALTENRLVVHYQPIIDLASGHCVSAEALVRIRHDDRLFLPDTFIDVAEETGLIVAVDEHVFRCAVAQTTLWAHQPPAKGFRGVSVNISGRHLVDSHLVEIIAAALCDHDLPPASLIVEVTERALMEASNSTMDSIRAIRDLGVPVGLDDFGTGYSSLAYLQQFPLDFIKIDRSFVSSLDRSPQNRAIVSAIIDLVHALGLTVIAEGVENTQQLDILGKLGCDQAQGFLIAPPDEPAAITSISQLRNPPG